MDISDSSLELVQSNGKNLKIEFGKAKTREKVKLKYKYQNNPVIICTPTTLKSVSSKNQKIKALSYLVSEIGEDYFVVDHFGQHYNESRFNWIAIGH